MVVVIFTGVTRVLGLERLKRQADEVINKTELLPKKQAGQLLIQMSSNITAVK